MSRLVLTRDAARRHRIRQQSRRYLAGKKAQVLRRLIACLEDLATQEFTSLSPKERARVTAVLDRLPPEIPAELVARLYAQLAEGMAA